MSITNSITYNDTGDKEMVPLSQGNIEPGTLVTITAGASDTYSVKVQMTKDSQVNTPESYKNSSGDIALRVPSQCYAIGLNISTNLSGSITFETFTK